MNRPAVVVLAVVAACGGPPLPPPPPPSNVTAPRRSTTPYTLAQVAGVMAIALDGDDIYVRTVDAIVHVERATGAAKMIARTAQPGAELAVTPWFVWWLDDGHVIRADRVSRKAERVPVRLANVYQLAATGSDVWITAGDAGPAKPQLLVFESEATAPHRVLEFAHDPPYGLAAADGVVAVSGDWTATSVVRDGALVDIDTSSAGPTFAVAGDRLVTAGVWIEMFPLDVGPSRIVAQLKMIELSRGGCFSLPGATDEPYTIEGMTGLAGGGGRFAFSSGEATIDPDDACRNAYVPITVNAGTGKVAVVDASGVPVVVATGEAETHALAVDARGVVWATETALRAIDR